MNNQRQPLTESQAKELISSLTSARVSSLNGERSRQVEDLFAAVNDATVAEVLTSVSPPERAFVQMCLFEQFGENVSAADMLNAAAKTNNAKPGSHHLGYKKFAVASIAYVAFSKGSITWVTHPALLGLVRGIGL
jgi:hypothetical protein